MSGLNPRTPRKAPRIFTVAWSDSRRRYVAAAAPVREANTAGKAGCRVTVKVQQGNGRLKTEYVARWP